VSISISELADRIRSGPAPLTRAIDGLILKCLIAITPGCGHTPHTYHMALPRRLLPVARHMPAIDDPLPAA
jgi:hypothetical protein